MKQEGFPFEKVSKKKRKLSASENDCDFEDCKNSPKRSKYDTYV